MAVTQAIAVSNGKGGVGKTTIAAHLAGRASSSGWQVLAVDLDPQANLGQDLGYVQDGRGDDGAALLAALTGPDRLEVLTGVRSNLDVVPAGARTDEVSEALRDRPGRLAEVLGEVVTSYDLVVVDCPPSRPALLDAALIAVRNVVIPTRADPGSTHGLELVASRFAELRGSANPDLVLLGVALFGVGASSKRIRRELRADLTAALDGIAPVFDADIREASRAAIDMRTQGLLAWEYAAAAKDGKRRRLRSLHRGDRKAAAAASFASNADGLAEDYERLADEILTAYTEGAHR